jgi:SiaC family regulatory phosphoprotein
MENLIIESTEQTPEVNFNVNGQLSIKGVSIPEHIADFYHPLKEWIDALAHQLPERICFTLEMEYINTSTSIFLIQLIKKIDAFKNNLPNITFVWIYEADDDDNYDVGRDLEHGSKAVFEYKTI